MMAEYGDRGEISDVMDVDVSDPLMDSLTGDFTGSAADASSNVNVNWHFNHSGISCRPRP